MDYIDKRLKNKVIVNQLKELKSNRLYTEEEFQNEIPGATWMENAIPQWVKYVIEGLAIGAYRKNFLGPRSKILSRYKKWEKKMCSQLRSVENRFNACKTPREIQWPSDNGMSEAFVGTITIMSLLILD